MTVHVGPTAGARGAAVAPFETQTPGVPRGSAVFTVMPVYGPGIAGGGKVPRTDGAAQTPGVGSAVFTTVPPDDSHQSVPVDGSKAIPVTGKPNPAGAVA